MDGVPRTYIATALLLIAVAVLVVVARSGDDASESASDLQALASQQEAWAEADRAWNRELASEGAEAARLSAKEARDLERELTGPPVDDSSAAPAVPDPSGDVDVSPQQLIAQDAEAKSQVRTAQTALEAYATDHGGYYEGAQPRDLMAIEPTLPASLELESGDLDYSLTVPSESGNSFTISRDSDGTLTFPCQDAGVGGCEASGTWL